MVTLCAAILTLGLGHSSFVGPSFYDAFVDPKEKFDIEVRQRRLSDNVELVNNTRLFLSAKMTSLDEKAEVLQPHVGINYTDVIPVIADGNLVGPQGSLLSGGWSTVMSYSQPNGRNALVSVITSGFVHVEELTPEERTLWNNLVARTITDQFLVPIINFACGVFLDSKEVVGVIAGLVTGHNSQIIEQVRDAAKSGSPQDVAYAIWQFCVREIETGGPIASYIARKYGINLAEKMAERIAKRIVISFIPGANAVEKFLFLLNAGGTFANFIPAAWDMIDTPAKLEYRAYFVPGLGDVYPKVIRMDGKDDEITLIGHKLVPIPGKTFRVRVFDKAAGKIYETSNLQPSINGYSLRFTLPESAIGAQKGPLEFELTIDKMTVKDPEKVEILHDLKVYRLEPDHGPPGTRVRIIAAGVYPYVTANTVFVQEPSELTPTRAAVELISKSWLEFTVPNLTVTRPTVHDVYVEEEAGRGRKQSRKLKFTVEPGTAREAAQKYRESAMPEAKFTFSGTLDATTPARTHPFEVPAGMQVETELLSVSGPEDDRSAGELENWNLFIITSPQGRPLQGYPLSDGFRSIASGQPAQRVTHTTGSYPVVNTYGISLRKKSTKPVSYRFEVRLFRRDDALSGRDAGDTFERALPIRNNERLNCRLSAEKKRFREDLKDIYRIDGIADDKEVVVTVSGAPTTYPFRNNEGTIQRMRLYCQGENDAEPYPVVWRDDPMSSRSSDVTMVHSARGNRSYFLEVDAGEANTEYWVEVLVRPATTPPIPITSITSFFDNNDEGWTLTGNFRTELSKPQYHSIAANNGYIYTSDASPEDTIGPLDVMVAVDTTGSMGKVIQSVRDSTLRIIEELRRRTSSLQVGLVSFKDVSADGASARTIVPLSSNVEQVLDSVKSWSASGGGSDGPEDMLYAAKGALQSNWRTQDANGKPVARVVIVITDVPPKVNASGADFEGNTLASIGALANSRNVRVFPVTVSSDAGALAAGEELALSSGGRALQLADPSKAADALLESCFAAIEPSSPMYWVAPQKFLGDKARYMGRSLQFSTYSYMRGSSEIADRFMGDDVILEGGGDSISFVGGIRPHHPVLYTEWNHYSIPLDSRGRWVHTNSREVASDTDIRKVLSALTGMKIRADYYAGQESVHLDNVVMGSSEGLTDHGLDENAKKLLSMYERWLTMSQTTSKEIDEKWTTFEANQHLEKVFTSRLGESYGLTSHMQWTSTITLQWIQVTNPGVRDRGFREVEKLIGKEIDKLRESGTATAADLADRRRAFNLWRGFASSVDAQMSGLLKLAVDICAAEQRLNSLNGEAYDRQRQTIDQLRKTFDERSRGLSLEADAMLAEWK